MASSLTESLFITAGICGVIALIFYHIKRLDLYRKAAKFPGPRSLPIIGNAHYFIGSSEDIMRKSLVLTDSYPSPFRLWFGNRMMLVIYDAEHIKNLLLNPTALEKGYMYRFMRPYVGTGLLTAPAAKWRVHRKLIQPTFNKRVLESFVPIFAKQAEIMTKQMRKELNKGEFDIFDYVFLCTLDIICESAMGVPLKIQTSTDTTYVDILKRGLLIIYLRMTKIWLHPDFLFNLSSHGRAMRSCKKIFHDVSTDVIDKKSAFNNETRVQSDVVQSKTRQIFLDLLLEMSKDGVKLTKKEIRDEVDTTIVAGSDTSATTDGFVFLVLANYPEIQEKVYQELCEIYGDEVSSDTPIGKDDLSRMEYLERVIKEAMRLFPPIHVLERQLTEDIQIGDYTVPKGISVGVSIIKIHRWEKYWPDPLKFDPDRFLPEEVAKRHPYSFLPFSGGPRNCIGQTYAMMSMKVVIATVLRRYVLKTNNPVNIENIKLKADILLRPADEMTVRIVERTVDKKNQL